VGHELRFERVFDAAPEEVFDAFTDPEGLEAMYGLDEPGWIVESEGDLRVGGVWSVAFGPSRGELYRFTHVFEVIDRPRRVVFASTEDAPDGTSFGSDVEVKFEGERGKTRMTLIQKGFPSAEIQDLHELGLPNAFDRLDRVVQARTLGFRGGDEPS
jgi:uncharacterized protein YndB with AHSA1/START domain